VVEDGGGLDIRGQTELRPHGVQKALIFPADDFRPVPAAAQGPEQYRTGRGTIRVNRRAPLNAENIAARPLRDNVAEPLEGAGNVRGAIAERYHRDSAVGDAADALCQLSIHIGDDRRLLIGGTREDDDVGWPALASV